MESYEHRKPWNKGKLVGQKAPLKPKNIWAIRIHLQNEHKVRDLALFNLATDSKLWLADCSAREAAATRACGHAASLSHPPERRLALFEEGGDALDEVAGRAAAAERFGFALQLRFDLGVVRARDQALDFAIGFARTRLQPGDELVGFAVELGGRQHAVDEAEAQRFGGIETLGEQQQLQRLAAADDARQEIRQAAVGREADRCIRGGEFGAVGARDRSRASATGRSRRMRRALSR